MLAMAILSLIGGLIALQISTALRDQRYKTEIDLIESKLRLTQELMLMMGVSIQVHFDKTPEGIRFSLEPITVAPQEAAPFFKQAKILLRAIQNVEWVEIDKIKSLPIGIPFYSKGFVMGEGVLKLIPTSSDVKGQEIVLKGYPHPVEVRPSGPLTANDKREQMFMMDQWTLRTRQEVQ